MSDKSAAESTNTSPDALHRWATLPRAPPQTPYKKRSISPDIFKLLVELGGEAQVEHHRRRLLELRLSVLRLLSTVPLSLLRSLPLPLLGLRQPLGSTQPTLVLVASNQQLVVLPVRKVKALFASRRKRQNRTMSRLSIRVVRAEPARIIASFVTASFVLVLLGGDGRARHRRKRRARG